jgi:ribulose-phosphate 3-epimerase
MIIPGIFEETTEKALQKISLAEHFASKIQLDLADGILVDGKTFLDLSFLLNIQTTAELQLHLMVQKPEAFLIALPQIIKDVCVPAEAFMYNPMCMESFDDVLRAKNIRVGLSFNYRTPFEDFEDCIKQCNYVQFMTVNPGGQGRPFIVESLDKISRFKQTHPDIPLQVDGGINMETMKASVEAGTDDVIVGSHIFMSLDPAQSYKDFVLQFEHARTNFLNSRKSQKN